MKTYNSKRRIRRTRMLTAVNISDKQGPTSPKIVPKCMVLNARSLAKPDAASALYAELTSNLIDICFVSETWLNDRIPTHLICPVGYMLLRKDRSDERAGGGVAIICRNDWQVKVLNMGRNFESVWCKITTSNSEFHVAVVYHPPDPVYDTIDLLNFMSDTCDEILCSEPNAKIIIAGDINKLNIRDLMSQQALQQIVKAHTRGQRTLDVFLTNCPFLWKSPTAFPSLVRSDHLAVMVSPFIPAKPSRKHVYFRDVREHRKINMEKKLKDQNWSNINILNDPNEAVRTLNDTLQAMFNESFPLIGLKTSSRDPPYMSPIVKHLCKIRNKNAHKRTQAENFALQTRINALIRGNQVNAVKNANQKHKKGSKGWWDTANKITGRKTASNIVSAAFNPGDINTYFQSVNTDLEYSAPELLPIADGTQVPTIEEHSVKQLLLHLKRTASGPDDLPYWLWRDYAHLLAPVITKIFNHSLREQVVPLLWKLANVSPIPKETPLTAHKQLRPISLTNIIMRLFERLVCRHELSAPLKAFIRPDQFAYKKEHNTTMALLKCQHYWLNWLEEDADFVKVYSFDFSKAFDSVSHQILCDKLKSLDVNPFIVNWIISFLSNRMQRVVVDGVSTEFVSINKGVPQGTVLGPVLFSIMVNDIIAVNPSRNLLTKYADDITLSVPVKSNVPDSAIQEVESIESWCRENRMTINFSKTWEMVVRGKTSKPLPDILPTIQRKSELKLLGVTFNEDPCNWDTHFDSILHKASSRLYILRVCKYYGYTLQELTILFDSLIMSLFIYGIEIWACAYEGKYLSRIDKFCRRAVVFGYTSKHIVIKELINVRDKNLWENIITNSQHCLHDLLPAKRKRNLRDRGHNYILPRVRTERFKRCFVNRCLFNLV